MLIASSTTFSPSLARHRRAVLGQPSPGLLTRETGLARDLPERAPRVPSCRPTASSATPRVGWAARCDTGLRVGERTGGAGLTRQVSPRASADLVSRRRQ